MENYSQIEILKAKKRVKKVKGFYIHLITYICVNSFFIIINLLKPNDGYWFIFPLLGWGIGLFADAAGTFSFIPFLNRDWENRKIKQFMDEERKALKLK
ncbi:2TM domain-containing protein [Flavobacterium sp. xlx-214]|uniref:2TM domain-containing protein n=1 Tax=unclassified Flavobacterium TaxID=196869 RepID=UPI0013D5885A|nr:MULTISPECIES: 2TM domain-containing protein [unclassified Flavobacterium]MBA5793692.1 2TM domain-containing protein [Flavobacterium sp. xlx-221]QMI83284.1 2TM domain-containing protein [Flavobacterium sp. xlx-214]